MSNFPSLRPLTRQTHSVCYLAVELEVVNQLAWREGWSQKMNQTENLLVQSNQRAITLLTVTAPLVTTFLS